MDIAPVLPATLRGIRAARRISQLELALRIGVSQRHVSFVEQGRSRPSRELLLAWLQALDAPLGVRNAALLQAGYAPAYGTRPLGDPGLAGAEQALAMLLAHHDPMPAFVLDASWNVLRMNRGAMWLAATLVPEALPDPSRGPPNLLDLFVHPRGLAACLANPGEAGPAWLSRLRQDAIAMPSLWPRVDAVAARLAADGIDTPSVVPPSTPLLVTRYRSPVGELAFFATFTTFGSPTEVTLASLRVEHLFAADEATRRRLHDALR